LTAGHQPVTNVGYPRPKGLGILTPSCGLLSSSEFSLASLCRL
jgi:hypothetical protein